ncbi:MAG: DUF4252 domain-containing protein [Tannerella sp.]|nr:DUF4252 domain-containing protein [Tannerella sp.]
MKKILMTGAVWLVTCTASYGQYSVERLFSEFSDTRGVERVSLGKGLMRLARCMGKDVRGVDGIEVLSFSRCEPALKNRLENAVRSLEDEDYETLLTSNEENERIRVLVKVNGDEIRELALLITGSDPTLIRLRGKIRPSDVEQLVNARK